MARRMRLGGEIARQYGHTVAAQIIRRPHCGIDELTARESQVLELMAQDRSNDDIAAELFIAISTVKTHVNHILRKLGQKTRVGAILEYQRLTGTSPPELRPEIHPGYDSNELPRD